MKTLRLLVGAWWHEFTENPRLYALFAAGPACMAAIVWLVQIVSDPRWGEPLTQLDILKLTTLMMCFTHMIVVVALAAVRVSGRGPGGFSFDVDSDDGHGTSTMNLEGQVTVTSVDPPPPPPTPPASPDETPPWERKS